MENKNNRLLNVNELMEYMGIGKTGAMRFGKEHGCIVRVGRRVLYDRELVDKAIDSLRANDRG